MNRLYDDIDDGVGKTESRENYHNRLQLAATKLTQQFDAPDIVALQEVENLRVLEDLANKVKLSGGPIYRAVLLEGNDISGIDVGFLVKSNLKVVRRTQLFKTNRLSLDNSLLFSRPPLTIEVCGRSCLTIVNLHLRSMRGLRSTLKGKRIARKRRAQAETLAKWIEKFQMRNPAKPILITGDFNALQPADSYTDIVGIIKGDPNNSGARYPGKDLITRDLVDLGLQIPDRFRFSFIYKGQKQLLDYMLADAQLAKKLKAIEFGEYDRSFSDHRGLWAAFSW